MGTTPTYGIYYDDPSMLALGRTQDQKQAVTIEAALSTVAAGAEASASEKIQQASELMQTQMDALTAEVGESIEAVKENSLVPIEAKTGGSYEVGTNFRGRLLLSGAESLAALGVPSDGDSRLLMSIEAPSSGTYEVGTNFMGRPVGGGVSSEYVESQVDALPDVAQRELLRDRARRVVAAPRRTTAKAVVAIVADDYPAATLDIFAPMMKARALPWSWALNGNTFDSGYSYAGFSAGKSWADVKAMATADGVEICNHGATHADVTSVAQMKAEIIGSRDRLRAETGQDVLGFIPPGCDFPEGVQFKTAPLISTKGELALVGTAYDRWVNYGHAWATGTMNNPTLNDFVHPLDGAPRMNAGRQWLDFGNDGGVAPGGIGEKLINKAVANGGGVILGLHACYIEGGGAAQRMTRAGVEGFLDRLKARRDAGEIEVVTMTRWHFTEIGK